MAGKNQLLTFGLIGAGGWLAYKYLLPGLTSTPSTPATPSTPTSPAFNSLDAIYSRFAAASGTEARTPHAFNYILQKELPAGKTAPAPESVFTQAGFDSDATMTISQYWGAMAPYLKSNLGLSGVGMFGGLGMLVRRGLY